MVPLTSVGGKIVETAPGRGMNVAVTVTSPFTMTGVFTVWSPSKAFRHC